MEGGMALLVMILSMFSSINGEMDGVGAIQFRISESEFSKVSQVLLQNSAYITYREDNTLQGMVETSTYSLENTQVREGTPTSVEVTIPRDDHMRATASFSDMRILGDLHITNSSNMTTTATIDVPLGSVDMVAEGQVDTTSVIGDPRRVILSVPSCNVTHVTPDVRSEVYDQTGLTPAELNQIIKEAICEMFHLEFSLGFKEAKIDMNLEVFDLYVKTRAVSLQIKNSTFIVTQVLAPTTDQGGVPSYIDTDDVISQFPHLRADSAPFELWLNQETVKDLWNVYKLEHRIGEIPMPLNDILPLLPFHNISTGSIPFITQIYLTFPDATADLILDDADVSLNVTDDTIQFNFNLTGRFEVTLNCNRSRKYSAFDFNMFAYVPTQIGNNNRSVVPKYTCFGGNMTVFSSNIGHVADRHLSVMFYALPQILGPGAFDDLNKNVRGFLINKLLPMGLYMENSELSIVKKHIIISGRLSGVDPKLKRIPRNDLDWIGDISMVGDLIFPITDRTPDNLKPLTEQNCSVPSWETAAAAGLNRIQALICVSLCCTLAFLMP